MADSDREAAKSVWWLMLGSSLPGLAVTACFLVVATIERQFTGDYPYFLLWFGMDAFLVFLSLVMLRRHYREEPPNWSGKWQLTLSDMLTIVFFCGAVMAIYRSLNPRGFSREGIPISLGIGAGYVIAVLFVSRVGCEGTLEKFSHAIGWLVYAGIVGALGLFFHFCIIYIIAQMVH